MRSLLPLLLVPGALSAAGCFEAPPESHYYRQEAPVYRPARVYDAPDAAEYAPSEAAPDEVVAGPVVEVRDFHERLSPYGRWVRSDRYGDCWAPENIDRSWRPYTRGHWVNTEYGWTWVSEEPFGWATYHYGRWAYEDDDGWVWVPGRTWGPAWVAWRSGGGYCGWAPLPPDRDDQVVVTEYEVDRIPPSEYVFCDERVVSEPRLYERCEPVQRNVTIINRTTNITNITVVNNRVINRGVPVNEVERVSGRRVQTVNVQRARSLSEVETIHNRDLQRVRSQPQQGQSALREQHAAEQNTAHERHVTQQSAEHNQHVSEYDAARQQRLAEHAAAVQAHAAEHNAHVAQDDAARQKQAAAQAAERSADVSQHDAGISRAQAAEQQRAQERQVAQDAQAAEHARHVAEQNAAHEQHVEEHNAAHDQHVAAQSAEQQRQAQEHDARVAAEQAARQKQATDRDPHAPQRAADRQPKQPPPQGNSGPDQPAH